MKNRPYALQAIIISLTLLSVHLSGNPARSQPAAASIVVNQEAKLITVNFSQADLERVEREATYVLEKLNNAGAKCCGKKKRISDCIWVCCDGNKVRTCDLILVRALEKLWKE